MNQAAMAGTASHLMNLLRPVVDLAFFLTILVRYWVILARLGS